MVGQLGGRSIVNGFYIYGTAPTEAIEEAAKEAVERLRAGEEKLAISPFCGTNFLLGGALTTIASAIVLGNRNRVGRLPQAVGVAVLGLVASFRLGAEVQRRWTTLPQVGGLQIERVERKNSGAHRVYTHYEEPPENPI